MASDPRDEAERLVAAALAAAALAARSTAGFATGSAECCVCPVCRAIAAMRDPSPEFAERLATGVGDLATGLAGVLRAFGSPVPSRSGPGASTGPGRGDDAMPDPDGDDVWRAATAPAAPSATAGDVPAGGDNGDEGREEGATPAGQR